MNILNIINSKELRDIPILTILRVVLRTQEELLNEESGTICSQLPKSNK